MSRPKKRPKQSTRHRPAGAPPPSIHEPQRPVEPSGSELALLQLDKAKVDLEKARADLAIAKWNSSAWGWTGPTKLTDLITPAVAVIAAFVALYSGHLNAILERTRAETAVLTIEKDKLGKERDRLEAELLPVKSEYDALRKLTAIGKGKLVIRVTKDLRDDRSELVIASGLGVGIEAMPEPTSEALAQIKNLRDLKAVELNLLPLTDSSLSEVDDSITTLGMSQCSLKGDLTTLLKRFTHVNQLDLRSFKTPVVTRKPFWNVRRLDLAYASISTKDLPAIVSSYPWVAQLDLSGTQVSDEGIEALVGLPKLRWLLCRNTAITVEGIRKLKKCPNLYSVSIDARVAEGFLDNGAIMVTNSEWKDMNPWLRGSIYDNDPPPNIPDPTELTP